jgi:hypothetical protein
MLEFTFRTAIIWGSAIKPVTSDATDATVTNVTDTAKFMYTTHARVYNVVYLQS